MDTRPEPTLLADAARPLVAHWMWIAVAVVIGALAAAGVVYPFEPTYESTAELLYRDVGGLEPEGRSDRSEHLAAIGDEVVLLESDRVRDAAAADVGSPIDASVERPDDGPVVEVTVTADTPEAATAGVSALVEAYLVERRVVIQQDFEATAAVFSERLAEVEELLAASLQAGDPAAPEVERLRTQRSEYQTTLDELRAAAQLQAERRVVLAGPPSDAVRSSDLAQVGLIVLGGLVGGLVAGSILFLRNQFRPRVYHRRDLVQHGLGVPCLGRVDRHRSGPVALDSNSDRWTTTQLLTRPAAAGARPTASALLTDGAQLRSVLVLAGSDKDRPASVAVAIARLLAPSAEVTLVDLAPGHPLMATCDVDAPLLDPDDTVDREELVDAITPVGFAEDVSLLAVSSAADPGSGGIVTAAPTNELVALLAASGRHSVVVPAPLADGGPPLELEQIDSAIIACRTGQPVANLVEQRQLLMTAGLDVLGVVLVGRSRRLRTRRRRSRP